MLIKAQYHKVTLSYHILVDRLLWIYTVLNHPTRRFGNCCHHCQLFDSHICQINFSLHSILQVASQTEFCMHLLFPRFEL